MAYTLAWIIILLGTICLAALVYYPLRHKRLLSSFIISVGFFWALCPWRIDDENYAPIFVVLLFRMFLEKDADASTVAAAGFLGTMGIVLVFLVIVFVHALLRRTRGPLRGRRTTDLVE